MPSTPTRLTPFLAAATLLAGCATAAPAAADRHRRGTVDFTPCHLAAPGMGDRLAAECGILTVPEDPDAPGGRRIDLRIAVLPAVTRDPEPDAILFLAGGPGQAATEAYPAIASAFNRLGRSRDIVLVDQRGTGGSHAFDCPSPTEGESAAVDTDPEQLGEWAKACLAGIDADPRQYTTTIAVGDLERVRAALGYDAFDLIGMSYGTRVGLEYARRHPDRTRAMVLDGVLAPEVALGERIAADAQRSLDLILGRCAADAECGSAFPGIGAGLPGFLAGLDAQPVVVDLAHPVTGRATSARIDRARAAAALRFASYSPEMSALIPFIIHSATVGGDLRPLAAQYLSIVDDIGGQINSGMHYSVICAEDVPFIDAATVGREGEGTYLGTLIADGFNIACAEWPRGTVPPDFKEPVTVDVPALVLSGEADPVTPPAGGEAVAAALPRALHLVAPGMGHGIGMRGCLPRLIDAFIQAASAAGLDTACVGSTEPPAFFVSATGPAAP